MRNQEQPKSFAELEQVISDMKHLAVEKERERVSRSSSSGHNTDTTAEASTESFSKCDSVNDDEVWVKRINEIEDIWTGVKVTNNSENKVQKNKKRNRRVKFSTLTECPLSHSKTEKSEKDEKTFLSSPVVYGQKAIETTNHKESNRCLISNNVTPIYREHQVAEFYGTNTFGTETAHFQVSSMSSRKLVANEEVGLDNTSEPFEFQTRVEQITDGHIMMSRSSNDTSNEEGTLKNRSNYGLVSWENFNPHRICYTSYFKRNFVLL